MSSGIALILLPTIFVLLRFVSRWIAQAGFWWDDLLVVLSLLLSYAPNASMMQCESRRMHCLGDKLHDADIVRSGANQWVWKTLMGAGRSNA